MVLASELGDNVGTQQLGHMVLALCLCAFIAYILSSVYSVAFHPLAKYSGPFFAKFSVWPSWYHTVRGDRHIWLWQCVQRYGSPVRIRPDAVLFNTPSALRAVYETKANVKKGKYYEAWPMKIGSTSTWSTIDAKVHARKRRILNAAFSDKALRSSEPYVIQHADRWCELLLEGGETDWSPPRNMAEWSDNLIFDIMGELCYSESFNIKEPGKNPLKFIPKFMVDYLSFLHNVANSPWVDLWIWLKPRGLDWLRDFAQPKNLRLYTEFIESCLTKRIKEEKQQENGETSGGGSAAGGGGRKDIFHYIFQSKGTESEDLGYTRGELFNESDLLVIAGSDTTSTVLAAIFFYLTREAQARERLVREVRGAFGDFDEIRPGARLTGCRYLRAFVDEALRMNPPVGSEANRVAVEGGLTVDGEHFLAGTNVGVAPYCLHHDGDIFPDPFRFRPERWIVDERRGTTPEMVARAEAAFCPFLLGMRGCPGKHLAYMEMTVTVAKVLYVADIRLLDGDTLGEGGPHLIWGRRVKSQYQVRDNFGAITNGPLVQFRRREV